MVRTSADRGGIRPQSSIAPPIEIANNVMDNEHESDDRHAKTLSTLSEDTAFFGRAKASSGIITLIIVKGGCQ